MTHLARWIGEWASCLSFLLLIGGPEVRLAQRPDNAGEVERRMRSWTLPFLIRHSAYHTLDHAWEMEDKDLTAEDGA